MHVHHATIDDADAIVETITLAFMNDPIWGPALAELDNGKRSEFWRFYVEDGLQNSTVYMADAGAAIALWIPPEGVELAESTEADLTRFVMENLSPASAAAMVELWRLFETNHPHDRPHVYLSLLATHPDHRGKGIGQQLLAENLTRFDAEGLSAYLESSNPANLHRYRRAGFREIGGLKAVLDDAWVTTMWRDPASS